MNSLGDIAEMVRQSEERLARECVADSDGITLWRHYHIEWDRIRTPRDLIEWLHHLSGKHRFDAELERRFIETVFRHRRWQLYRGV